MTQCHTTVAPRARRGADLIRSIPSATGGLCFVTGGTGLVGWGRHAALTTTGADAATTIAAWYADQLACLAVTRDVTGPGTGPVCFVSLGFGPDDESVAVIPEVVLGSRDGQMFVTRIGDPGTAPATDAAVDSGAGPVVADDPAPMTAPGWVTWSDQDASTVDFTAAVASAITRIQGGEASKVVLAHALSAFTELAVDERYLLTQLAESYPSCTAFAVEGLVGASPETLIRREGALVSSRVLAGTAWPAAAADGRPTGQHLVAEHLLASGKDLAEHRYAVDSVADVLRGMTSYLQVPAAPSALELTNLTHLATDIRGELAGPAESAPTALELAARLHPSAAVGGTPTAAAQAMIRELEPQPRGRYAAPVGWIDPRGDGEFAIALRCAQVAGQSVTLMAGCGIVADSDPATEAREAQVKMIPVREALR